MAMGDQQAWPKGFRAQFLNDFTQFLGDPNYTPQHMHVHNVNNNNNTSFFPSQEDLRFLTEDVSQYITNYVSLYSAPMSSRQKPPQPHPLPSDHFAMARFINQKDDHFTGIKVDPVPLPTATPTDTATATAGDPRFPIQQANRGLHKWRPKEYADTSITATTREHSNNKAHKTVASHTAATTFSIESAVGGLCQAGPLSRGGVSRTGSLNGIRHRDSYRCENRDKKRSHPGELFTPNQGMSAEAGVAGLNRRASAGSRISSISRREPKQHACPVCCENFPFNARLQSHMAVHRKSNEKIICPVCGSGFGRDSSLKRHQNTPSCQKKKQAKLLDASHPDQIGGSNHTFDEDSTTSYHDRESDVSTENVLQNDPQYHPPMQHGAGLMSRNHASASPVARPLHGGSYSQRQSDGVSAFYHSQGPGQGHPIMWAGLDPNVWPGVDYQGEVDYPVSREFRNFIDYENEGD